MKQVRKNVFETNSSSTHSICIAKDVEPIIPKSLHFAFGEFGWECDEFEDTYTKASYLYTGLIANDRKEDFDNIVKLLQNKGIEVTFEESTGDKYHDQGYVDHSGDLYDFLDAVVKNEKELLNFLFSPFSYIVTGNDNDDQDVDINVNYPHTVYYKGN